MPSEAAHQLLELLNDLPMETKAFPARTLAVLCQANLDGRDLARYACDQGIASNLAAMLASNNETAMGAAAAAVWMLSNCGDERVRRTVLWESGVLWNMVEKVTALTQKGHVEGSYGAAAMIETMGRLGCERATVGLRLSDLGGLGSLLDVLRYTPASIDEEVSRGSLSNSTAAAAAASAATSLAAIRAVGRLARGHFEQARRLETLGALAMLMQRLTRLVPERQQWLVAAAGDDPQRAAGAAILESWLASPSMRRESAFAQDLAASLLMSLSAFAALSSSWARSLADAGLVAAVCKHLEHSAVVYSPGAPMGADARGAFARRAWAARVLVDLVSQCPDLAVEFVRSGVVAKLQAMLVLDYDGGWDGAVEQYVSDGAPTAEFGLGFGDDLPHGMALRGPYAAGSELATCGWRRCEVADCSASCVAAACEALGALAKANTKVLQYIAASTRTLREIVALLPSRRRRRGGYSNESQRIGSRVPTRRADVRTNAVLAAAADTLASFASDAVGEGAMPPNVMLKLSVVLHDAVVGRDVLQQTARAIGILGYGNAKMAFVVVASGCIPVLVQMAETVLVDTSENRAVKASGGSPGSDAFIEDTTTPTSLSLRGCAAEAIGNLAHDNARTIEACLESGAVGVLTHMLRDDRDPSLGELDRQCAAVALESLHVESGPGGGAL